MDYVIDIVMHTEEFLTSLVKSNLFLAYCILFLIIFLESGVILFPFLPGDGLLLSAGIIASNTDLNIWVVIILLIIAAILGNLLNYRVGTSTGRRIMKTKYSWLKGALESARKYYARHGGKAILMSRFFPVLRTYVPFIAGAVGLEYAMFVKLTIIGAIVWVTSFTLIGFVTGDIPWVEDNFGLIVLALILSTGFVLIYNGLKKFVFDKPAPPPNP